MRWPTLTVWPTYLAMWRDAFGNPLVAQTMIARFCLILIHAFATLGIGLVASLLVRMAEPR